MYVLYLDDAGSVSNSKEKHFILAGIAVFERQAFYLQKRLDDLVASLGHPDPSALELHGNAILGARKGSWWRKLPPEKRRTVISDGLKSAQSLYPIQRRLFGVVVDKNARSPEDPVEYAFSKFAAGSISFCNAFTIKGIPRED